MPRKTSTLNLNQRSRKFAARGKGVESNNLQGLKAVREAEVSRYNSVKNTDSAYNGHRLWGRGFLKNLVAKRERDEADGLIDDGICTAILAKAFNDGPPNIWHLHSRCLLFRNVSMKAAGRIQLTEFSVRLQHSGMLCSSANYLYIKNFTNTDLKQRWRELCRRIHLQRQ